MKILYNLATRGRSEQCKNTIENILSLAAHNDFLILVTFDNDDADMCTEEMTKWLYTMAPGKLYPMMAGCKSKIEAINKHISWGHNYAWDICVNISDDQAFIKIGFDIDIISEFTNFDGLVHFVDSNQKGICTLGMVSRKYYNIDGFFYHSNFYSVYSDNFQQELAKKRGMYKFVDQEIFVHKHWRWGKSKKDELYQRNETREVYAKDRETYLKLKKEYHLT